jgi:hypothetical protein
MDEQLDEQRAKILQRLKSRKRNSSARNSKSTDDLEVQPRRMSKINTMTDLSQLLNNE